jgi:sigma-B regulation protein RsbU (phosphoserine phosphatase)
MHSLSVLNAIKQRAVPATDLTAPVRVLSRLNVMFPMDRHDDQYFTMWYGVYDSRCRSLIYSSGGHHPAFLVPADRRHAAPLRTSGTVIGACADVTFTAAEVAVPEGSSLYLFSDGVFEILTKDRQWHLSDFVPLLLQPALPGKSECRRLCEAVRAARLSNRGDDDFSLLVVTFP